jgi:hypothetical protein
MSYTAIPVADAIPVTKFGTYDGVVWLQTEVADLDFAKYKALPSVVSCNGMTFRKMSFNTDNGTVSYRESQAFAVGV